MPKLRLQIKWKKVVDTVVFPDADRIDRTRLAEKLGVTRPLVAYWIKTGKVPDEYIPMLKAIDFDEVLTNRKPYERKKSR